MSTQPSAPLPWRKSNFVAKGQPVLICHADSVRKGGFAATGMDEETADLIVLAVNSFATQFQRIINLEANAQKIEAAVKNLDAELCATGTAYDSHTIRDAMEKLEAAL